MFGHLGDMLGDLEPMLGHLGAKMWPRWLGTGAGEPPARRAEPKKGHEAGSWDPPKNLFAISLELLDSRGLRSKALEPFVLRKKDGQAGSRPSA
jgi:hypothetical protein